MAAVLPIIQRNTDYVLSGTTWSASVAASASYNVTDLQYLLPAKRIQWGVKTVTITATMGSAVQGDIFALPFSNIDAGATVLSITNNGGGGGINQAVTVPAASPGGWPTTAWIDLTDPTLNGGAGWSVTQRTATTWNFVVTNNSQNLILGAAIWLSSPKRTLARNLHRTAKTATDYYRSVLSNEYGVDYVYDYGTMKRTLSGEYLAITTAERDAVRDWIDGCRGGGLPGLFVRDSSVNDALVAYMNVKLLADWLFYPSTARFALEVTELSKGKHL